MIHAKNCALVAVDEEGHVEILETKLKLRVETTFDDTFPPTDDNQYFEKEPQRC